MKNIAEEKKHTIKCHYSFKVGLLSGTEKIRIYTYFYSTKLDYTYF